MKIRASRELHFQPASPLPIYFNLAPHRDRYILRLRLLEHIWVETKRQRKRRKPQVPPDPDDNRHILFSRPAASPGDPNIRPRRGSCGSFRSRCWLLRGSRGLRRGRCRSYRRTWRDARRGSGATGRAWSRAGNGLRPFDNGGRARRPGQRFPRGSRGWPRSRSRFQTRLGRRPRTGCGA